MTRSTRPRWRSAGTALALALLLAFDVAAAEDAEATEDAEAAVAEPGAPGSSADWVYALWNELMSPFCPGRTLNDCPSPQAQSLRLWIQVQAAAGRSRDDVVEDIYAQYGDVVRSAPRAQGFGTAAYAMPVLVFLAGGGLVVWFLRRWTRAGADEPAPAAAALDPDLERRLDEELAR